MLMTTQRDYDGNECSKKHTAASGDKDGGGCDGDGDDDDADDSNAR